MSTLFEKGFSTLESYLLEKYWLFITVIVSRNDKETMELKELQQYIGKFDSDKDYHQHYVLKLMEEVGELSEAIRKGQTKIPTSESDIKGTVGEELYDVLYYVCALANVYDIDLEKMHRIKNEINKKKWGRSE